MSVPRQYIIVRWRHGAGKTPADFPICEDCFATLDAVAKDILDGQVEDVAQVVSIDLDKCSAFDLTNDAFQRAADLSFDRAQEPYPALERQFDKLALRYFGLACRETAYLRGAARFAAE